MKKSTMQRRKGLCSDARNDERKNDEMKNDVRNNDLTKDALKKVSKQSYYVENILLEWVGVECDVLTSMGAHQR